MKYGQVPGIEKPISRLVQGINRVRSLGEEDGFALLDSLLALGCNVYDTGRVYGPSDAYLGRWIASRGIRDRVVILGKGAHHNAERQRVTPEDIREDLDTSLREMGTDYIDLYILHRDDPTVPVGPLVEVLNEAHRAGKIHAFGGSNWTTARIAEANAYAHARGLIPFTVSNPNYSLAEQVAEPWENCVSIGGPGGESEVAWYREQQMPVFAWSSLAAGFLSGRVTRANRDAMAEQMKLTASSYYSEENFQRLDRAQEIAQAKGATVPQIALSWLFHQGVNLFALVGCMNAAEMQANIDALNIVLTPTEVAYLNLKADAPA